MTRPTTPAAPLRTATLAVLLALTTSAAWIAKDFAIVSAGGLGRSPAEGPLFLLGLALALAGSATLGVAAAGLRTRSRVWCVVGAVAATLVVGLLGTIAQVVVVAVRPPSPGWEWAEMNLWVIAAALLVAALVVRTRAQRTTRSAPGKPTERAATGSKV